MIKRKEALREMLAPISEETRADQRPPRAATQAGSLKAMGLSLQSLSDDADEAHALRAQLASGEHVIELDPRQIEPSFISDRLNDCNSTNLAELVESIAEHGQQVPILVRPIPNREGHYQVAFGHRRLEALRRLEKPVKAIVRQLSDEQLVIAQGKENLERRNLSFVEQAFFASRLEDHGFNRSAIMAAISAHKGNLSTMIGVVRAIPEALITAIGPAPKVGRPRWEQLAALIQTGTVDWVTIISAEQFLALGSDARFQYILKTATLNPTIRGQQYIQSRDGSVIAGVDRAKGRVKLTIDDEATSSFGSYLIHKLPDFYAAFQRHGDE